jgi:1-deoxy-D-xylulose-5-phosphate reductoisomerase
LDLIAIGRLDFEPVSFERFPCLRLAYQALKAGGTATAILNAANEVAVDAFCQHHIRFDQIAMVIDAVMQKSNVTIATDLNGILIADAAARKFATQIIKESVYSVQK